MYYDGIALSRGDLANDAEVNPSVEAVGEFKLITNNYSSEYTHALSGVTTFTMKSGTNDLHGSAFHFLANDKLDARGFFSPTKAPRKQNEWGFTVGGPVRLPKLYNGRDRTFFFFSLDQFYIRGGQLGALTRCPRRACCKAISASGAGRFTIHARPPWTRAGVSPACPSPTS